MTNEQFNLLKNAKLIPVIQIDATQDAIPLVKTLIKAGIEIVEITMRTPVALDAIKAIRHEFNDLFILAGTVLSPEQAKQAMAAGANGIVTPGFNPLTIDYCVANDITIVPGAATPGEMEQAMNRGLSVLKFFPAEASGGISYLKAVSAPYSMLKFMPTGGINPKNINDYLEQNCVLCCGGSWMVDKSLIKEQKWDEIYSLSVDALKIVNKE